MISRRTFLTSASAAALLFHLPKAEAMFVRGTGAVNTQGALPPLNTYSLSGTQTTPQFRFAQVFAPGDLKPGQIVTLTDPNGTSVPFTPVSIGTDSTGNTRIVEFLCHSTVNIPTGSVSNNILTGGAKFQFNRVSGSWNTTLPNGKTEANILADLQANFSNYAVELTSLFSGGPTNGTVVGSGNWMADVKTGLADSTPNGTYQIYATGPTNLGVVIKTKFYDEASPTTRHAQLNAWFYLDCWLDSTTGAVKAVQGEAFVCQGIMTQDAGRFSFKANVVLFDSTNTKHIIRTFGQSTDNGGSRAISFASTDMTMNNPTSPYGAYVTTPSAQQPAGYGQMDMIVWRNTGGHRPTVNWPTLANGLAQGGITYAVRVIDANTLSFHWYYYAAGAGALTNELRIELIGTQTGGLLLNGSQGTLTGNLTASSSDTSVPNTNGNLPSTGSFTFVIDNEAMLVTAGAGTGTYTVTRGALGTTIAAHTSGAIIYQCVNSVISAVNTSNDTVTMTAHGLTTGQTFFFNGTMPTGTIGLGPFFTDLTNPTSKGVIIFPCFEQNPNVILGPDYFSGTGLIADTGSGTHSFDYFINMMQDARLGLHPADGSQDWWIDATGVLGTSPPVWVVQDTPYLDNSGMNPKWDRTISVTFLASLAYGGAASNPVTYSPASLGMMPWFMDNGGADEHIGVFAQWGARLHGDLTNVNLATTAIAQALHQGTLPNFFVSDDTIWRMPVVNNGHDNSGTPYTGLATPAPLSYVNIVGGLYNGLSPRDMYTGPLIVPGYGGDDSSHYPNSIYPVYIIKGRRSLHDLLVSDSHTFSFFQIENFLAPSNSFGALQNRAKAYTPTTALYTTMYQLQPRGDAWAMRSMVCAAVAIDSNSPEAPYIKDIVIDTYKSTTSFINNDGNLLSANYGSAGNYNETSYGASTSHQTLGVWNTPASVYTQYGAEALSMFMHAFNQLCYPFAYQQWQSSDALLLAQFVSRFTANTLINGNCAAIYSGTYRIAIQRQPLFSYYPDGTDIYWGNEPTDWLPTNELGAAEVSGGSGSALLAFASDGTCTRQSPVAFFSLNNGDEIRLSPWDWNNGPLDPASSNPSTVPNELAFYTDYTITNVNNTTRTFQIVNPATGTPFTSFTGTYTQVTWWYLGWGSAVCPTNLGTIWSYYAQSGNQGYVAMQRAIGALAHSAGLLSIAAYTNINNNFVGNNSTNAGFPPNPPTQPWDMIYFYNLAYST